jgi:hypothetical protein
MSDPNQPYHNKGFGVAFLWIIIITMLLPIAAMMTIDDTWDRFLQTNLNRIWICRQSRTQYPKGSI